MLPLVAAAAGLGLLAVSGRPLPSPQQLSVMPGLPDVGWVGVLLLCLVVNGYGEEVGWRGYLWPLLRRRHGAAAAGALLALPWAAWHLPTFWLDTGLRGFAPLMVPGWLVGLAAGTVVMGWLYERSGSLFVVALFHASLNMASATEGTRTVAAVPAALVMVWAIVLLRRGTTPATSGSTPSAAATGQRQELPGGPRGHLRTVIPDGLQAGSSLVVDVDGTTWTRGPWPTTTCPRRRLPAARPSRRRR